MHATQSRWVDDPIVRLVLVIHNCTNKSTAGWVITFLITLGRVQTPQKVLPSRPASEFLVGGSTLFCGGLHCNPGVLGALLGAFSAAPVSLTQRWYMQGTYVILQIPSHVRACTCTCEEEKTNEVGLVVGRYSGLCSAPLYSALFPLPRAIDKLALCLLPLCFLSPPSQATKRNNSGILFSQAIILTKSSSV